ncbi:MAG: hypothetical protein ACXABY_13485 [Candidatus Thorarchaeota archaeon]|jgi:hypothetical protein
MSLATTHKEYITEQLLLAYLKDGIIPTADQLEADLETYMEDHPNLEEPTSKTTDFTVERGTSASSAKIQEIADTVSQDVGIVTREIYKQAEDSNRFYDRWSAEMKRLSGIARKLEERVDSMLLLTEDTAGFFAHVSDVFSDMNEVDLENTTAKINLYEATVSLDPLRSELSDGSGGALIDLTGMTENDVSFYPLTKKPGLAYFSPNADNALVNIFKTDNSTWVGKVVANTTGEMVCELKAKLADEDLEVSRVSFFFVGPTTTSRSTATLQYSADGYTWHLVSTTEATKALVRNMVWSFPQTTLRWLKIIFRKPAPDSTANEYIFSASHMKVYGNTYSDTVGNTLQTKSLQALDIQENPILFSLVALETCQELPTNTGIDYSIAASQDNSTWTSWMRISTADSTGVSYPKIINLGGVDWKDNKVESTTTRLDNTVATSGLSQMKATRTFSNTTDIPGLLGYRFKDDSFATVNTAIPISTDEDPDPIGNSVIVWRNMRYKNINNYPDTATVRDTPRGWGLDGGRYSCYFEVVDKDGILLDFGDRVCVLDDTEVSGAIRVPVGIHKFITDSENWVDISEEIVGLNSIIQTEDQLKAIDPLYPHNHKLVIEGFPYGTGYRGERLYKGTDISAEFYATRTSLFDLENNVSDYGYFAIRGVGNASYPTLAVIIQSDVTNPDDSNELFLVNWRSGDTDASMFSYIKLKATLWTQDTAVTPSWSSYRLKLGM